MITITAGHSNTDPGAVNGSIREADVVRDMRNMVAVYLERAGVDFKTDGTGTQNLPLREAVRLIAGSKVAVEFHCNAAANKSAKGVEALAHASDKVVSQKLCKAVADELGTVLRGDKGWKPENSGQHSRLAFVSGGGIILELFFISNEAELKAWHDKKWLVARAVANVLIEHVK